MWCRSIRLNSSSPSIRTTLIWEPRWTNSLALSLKLLVVMKTPLVTPCPVIEPMNATGAWLSTTGWRTQSSTLSHPLVAPILLSLGVLGLVIEIKTPSFGLAGLVGLASLGAFFGSHLIIGLAGWEEVILLGAGLIALGIEVFVVPGFGIAGVVSIACIGTAIFLALLGSLPTWADVARAAGVLATSVGIIGAAIYLVVRNLPTSDRWRGIFLRTASAATEGFISGDLREDLIGRVGVALTDLHPGGTVQLDDERLDVITEGDYVKRGTHVRIMRSEGYRLVVKPLDQLA